MHRHDHCCRGSAAHRVRIVLALKNLGPEVLPRDLLEAGERSLHPGYRRLRAEGSLLAWSEHDLSLSQSIAIIEYLDEAFPYPPLLPADPAARARVRAIAIDVACEIHPINNQRVLRYLTEQLSFSDEQKIAWCRHWLEAGLAAAEARVAGNPQSWRFCQGEHPTLADCCLVPQVFNARQLNCRLDHVPNVLRIDAACLELPAFAGAEPGRGEPGSAF